MKAFQLPLPLFQSEPAASTTEKEVKITRLGRRRGKVVRKKRAGESPTHAEGFA